MIYAWVGALQKTDLETNLLNLKNRRFENVSFSQLPKFDIPLLITLFISLIKVGLSPSKKKCFICFNYSPF